MQGRLISKFRKFFGQWHRHVKILLVCLLLGVSAIIFLPRATRASCIQVDCSLGEALIKAFHELGEDLILAPVPSLYNSLRDFITKDFFLQHVLPALQQVTRHLNAVGMNQMFVIGTFFDAKNQLETQRLFQELQVVAYRDYMPSEEMCWIGTGARSLAPSEELSRYNAYVLSKRQMARHLGKINTSGSESRDQDKLARWERFMNRYCDPEDNAWNTNTGSGLVSACGAEGGGASDLLNIDINYTRLMEEKRSLNAAFNNEKVSGYMNASVPETNEQDVIAMGNNLYGHDVLTRNANAVYLQNESAQQYYLALRSVAARRAVAEHSYNSIAGLKSSGSSAVSGDGEQANTRAFLAAFLKELGVGDENGNGSNDDEIYMMLGQHPSYYAQLEILAKKIYQNSNFYFKLQDTPANIARKGVALKAIELMLDRAIYESELRQEMATSVLLSSRLRDDFLDVKAVLGGQE